MHMGRKTTLAGKLLDRITPCFNYCKHMTCKHKNAQLGGDYVNLTGKVYLIHRAVEILKYLPFPQESDEAENSGPEPTSDSKSNCQQRMYLWSGIVKCAWSARLDQIVLAAAPYALQPQWTPENDRHMIILQVYSLS